VFRFNHCRRIHLGLLTNTPASDSDEEVEDEQWEDFDDESEEDKVTEYCLATHSRSSIDLLSTLANDSDSMMRCNDSGSNMDASSDLYGSKDGLIVDFDSSFRTRSRKPGVSSIHEEAGGL
jgi:hypothetical protein